MSETGDTLNMLVEAVRRFTREVLVPLEAQVEETDEIPLSVIQQMRELGLYGMSIPEEYGGLGLSMYEQACVIAEIGFAAPAFRACFGGANGVGTQGLLLDGTLEQRSRYLPRIASGELIASFCLTEPDSGSDAASLSTSAVREGDDYVITGTKRFITNSPSAGLFTVFARTGPKSDGSAGISAFLVERGIPGLSVGPHYRKMGFRGSRTADVMFDGCRVPASALLGGREGLGFRTAMKSLDCARLQMAALAVGLCERVISEGVRYANERRQFGQPIGNFQLVQAMLADSVTESLAGRSMVEKVARAYDHGETVQVEAACCKYFVTEALGRIADRVLQVHGGYGYVKEYPIERLYRDVRLLRIYEGTSQILQLLIGRKVLSEATT